MSKRKRVIAIILAAAMVMTALCGCTNYECSTCLDTHKVACFNCGGSGACACDACKGTEKVKCTSCGGTGQAYFPGVILPGIIGNIGGGFRPCAACGSTGQRVCASCTDGKQTCSVCTGTGFADCPDCIVIEEV